MHKLAPTELTYREIVKMESERTKTQYIITRTLTVRSNNGTRCKIENLLAEINQMNMALSVHTIQHIEGEEYKITYNSENEREREVGGCSPAV